MDVENQCTNQRHNSPKKNQTRRVGRVYKYFKEYCDNSGIHGFRYLAESRTVGEKLLWLLLIITALSVCGFFIFQIYSKYQQTPIIVSFATKETAIFNVPFPAVTICPLTKARRSVFNFSKTFNKIKIKQEHLTIKEFRYVKYMAVLCNFDDKTFPMQDTFSDDIFTAMEELNLQHGGISSSCHFITEQLQCDEIFTPIILDQGICFTFNMLDRSEILNPNVVHYSTYHYKKKNKTNWTPDAGYTFNKDGEYYPERAFLAGSDNALTVKLSQNEEDIDPLCPQDAQGFSVSIHPPHSIPQVRKQYFIVPFGRSVIAVVHPKVMTTSEKVLRYPAEKRQCYFATEKALKYFKIYSPDNCKLECYTNYTLKKCGCVNFYMPRENGTSICGNEKLKCMRKAERKLKYEQFEIQENSNGEAFYCDCKPLCSDLSYDIDQSQSPWEFDAAMKKTVIGTLHKRYLYSKISVFFKQDSYLTSERNELYGPTDFIANFGGLLGLFTGFSLLSAVEILYFLTIRIFCNFRLSRRSV